MTRGDYYRPERLEEKPQPRLTRVGFQGKFQQMTGWVKNQMQNLITPDPEDTEEPEERVSREKPVTREKPAPATVSDAAPIAPVMEPQIPQAPAMMGKVTELHPDAFAPVQPAMNPASQYVSVHPRMDGQEEASTIYIDRIHCMEDCIRVATSLRMDRKKIVTVSLEAQSYKELISYFTVLYGACLPTRYRMYQACPGHNVLELVSSTSTVEMSPQLQHSRRHSDIVARYEEVLADMIRYAEDNGESIDEDFLPRRQAQPAPARSYSGGYAPVYNAPAPQTFYPPVQTGGFAPVASADGYPDPRVSAQSGNYAPVSNRPSAQSGSFAPVAARLDSQSGSFAPVTTAEGYATARVSSQSGNFAPVSAAGGYAPVAEVPQYGTAFDYPMPKPVAPLQAERFTFNAKTETPPASQPVVSQTAPEQRDPAAAAETAAQPRRRHRGQSTVRPSMGGMQYSDSFYTVPEKYPQQYLRTTGVPSAAAKK